MRTSTYADTIARIMGLACLLFLLILIGFETVPLLGVNGPLTFNCIDTQNFNQIGTDGKSAFVACNDTQYINQAGLQRTRSQVFVKDALTLQYHVADKAQAFSDLQIVLPLFQAEQKLLNANPDPEIENYCQVARIDYLSLVAAVNAIIMHADSPIDPIQVNIILAHERNYLLIMNQLVSSIQRKADDHVKQQGLQLFYIQLGIEMLLGILIISFLKMNHNLIQRLDKGQKQEVTHISSIV